MRGETELFFKINRQLAAGEIAKLAVWAFGDHSPVLPVSFDPKLLSSVSLVQDVRGYSIISDPRDRREIPGSNFERR